MQIVDHQSYLGDQIGFSNAESITLTLNKRLGIARKAVFDIKTVLEDSRSTVAGGIKTGILLWESCVIPFLLNNCSTWMEIRSRDVERLNKVQNLFLNCLLGVFKSPVDLMYWDLKFLTINHRILKEKLLFFHDLKYLLCLCHGTAALLHVFRSLMVCMQ